MDEQSIFEAVAVRRAVVAQAAVKTKAARREFERTRHLRGPGRAGDSAGSPGRDDEITDADTSEVAGVPMPTDADRGSVEEWS